MRITAIVAFVAVVHIGSTSIAAQQPTNLFAPKSRSSPPRFLFPTPTPTPTLKQSPDVHLAPRPTVVCGLRLIPADPNVDPGIRHEVPENGPKFPIGSVDPKICRRP